MRKPYGVIVVLSLIWLGFPALAGNPVDFVSPLAGVITTAGVNLKAAPEDGAMIIGRIPDAGTRVEVLGEKDDWLKVKAGSGQAWLKRSQVDVAGTGVPVAAPAATASVEPAPPVPRQSVEKPVAAPPQPKTVAPAKAAPPPATVAGPDARPPAAVPAAATAASEQTVAAPGPETLEPKVTAPAAAAPTGAATVAGTAAAAEEKPGLLGRAWNWVRGKKTASPASTPTAPESVKAAPPPDVAAASPKPPPDSVENQKPKPAVVAQANAAPEAAPKQPSADEEKPVDKPEEKSASLPDDGEKPPEPTGEESDEGGVLVKTVEFSGNALITSKDLLKRAEPFLNRSLTMEEMGELADQVTMAYQEKGYILARAYLPEQEIVDGVLKINIAEGKVGKITVQGNKLYRAEVIKRYFKAQEKHGVVKEKLLEKGLVMTNELPKVKTNVVLKEGAKPGEVDVILNTEESAKLTMALDAAIDWNNYGNAIISRDRYGVKINVVDHYLGSTLEMRGITGHTYEDSALGNLVWTVPLNSYGTKAAVNYLDGTYGLATEEADRGLDGNTRIYGVKLAHPLIKDKNKAVHLVGEYQHKYSDNKFQLQTISRDELATWTAGIELENLDRYLGKNIASLAFTHGRLDPDDAVPYGRLIDPNPGVTSYKESKREFQKLALNLARIQKIYGYTNIMLRAGAQYTPDRLVNLEQVVLGGYGSVRGHEPAIYLGDSGYNLSAELMFAPPFIAEKTLFGQRLAQLVQFVAFYDHGNIYITNHTGGVDAGPKTAGLSGFGGGVRLFYKDRFSFKYDLGIPVDRLDANADAINYFSGTYKFF